MTATTTAPAGTCLDPALAGSRESVLTPMTRMPPPPTSSTSACPTCQPRSKQGPHAKHPFRRFYLGPSPVANSAAAATAAAIAEDAEVTTPGEIAIAGMPKFTTKRDANGPDITSDETSREPDSREPSFPPMGWGTSFGKTREFTSDGVGDVKNSNHAKSARVKRKTKSRDPSATSFTSFKSLASAKSFPRSVKSEADLKAPEETRKEERREMRGLRKESSVGGSLVMEWRPPGTASSTGSTAKGTLSHRRFSSSDGGERKRERSSSQSSVGHAPITRHSHMHHTWETSINGGKALPLLDLPVKEADESSFRQEELKSSSFEPFMPSTNENEKSAERMRAVSPTKGQSSVDDSFQRRSASHGAIPLRSKISASPSNFSLTFKDPEIGRVARLQSSEERMRLSNSPSHKSFSPLGKIRATRHSSGQESHSSDSPESSLTRRKGKSVAESMLAHKCEMNGGHPQEHDWNLGSSDAEILGDGGVISRRNDTDATRNADLETERDQRLKDRARSRFIQSRVGRGFPSQDDGGAQGGSSTVITHHGRDYSRQSRMSRASTAGTINTVGTKGTGGSFGASGGVKYRLGKVLLNGSMRYSARGSRRTRLRTHTGRNGAGSSHHRRMSSAGGVMPGSIGTSAGGTKWVGQTFEVGKRFWEILEARKEQVAREGPCLHNNDEPSLRSDGGGQGSVNISKNRIDLDEIGGFKAGDVEELKIKDTTNSSRALSRSPSGVLNDMAAQAQSAAGGKISEDVDADHQIHEKHLKEGRMVHDEEGALAQETSLEGHGNQDERMQRPRMASIASSIVTIPHDKETGPYDIENRKGWSDVLSFFTTNSTGAVSSSVASNTPRGLEFGEGRVRKRGHNRIRKAQSESKEMVHVPPSPSRQDAPSFVTAASGFAPEESSRQGYEKERRNGPTQLLPSPMTREEASKHPDPPPEAEERFPEAVHQLLRRQSDVGIAPGGPGERGDAASDHMVAAGIAAAYPAHDPLDVIPLAPLSNSPSRVDSWISSIRQPRDRALSVMSSARESRLAHSPASRDGSTRPLLDPQSPSTNRGNSNTLDKPEPRARKSSLTPALLSRTRPDSNMVAPVKKMVQFESSERARPPPMRSFTSSFFTKVNAEDGGSSALISRPRFGDTRPAPPEEVLSRPQPNTYENDRDPSGIVAHEKGPFHSAGEHEHDIITRKTVLKKDRMLVKVEWTPHEDLPKNFDELASRKFPVYGDQWREYIVVLRMGKVELWSDPTLTSKVLRHPERLKLRHTIPLSRGTTFLSLYSPIDRIFCLTYQPWKLQSSSHKARLNLRRQGTDIAIFDCRAHSVAADWMWELWRELGGTLPENVEIHLPSLGLKIRIPIPEEMPSYTAASCLGADSRGGEGYKVISQANVTGMIWKLVKRAPEWKDLLDEVEKDGIRFALAWRRGVVLDWVQHETSVDGQQRDWAVLCGAIMKEFRNPSILELRPARHYPTSVRLVTGETLDEPPAIEGYLWRVKPVSGALTRLYVTTHDSHAFVNRPSRAFPPDRHLATQLQEALDMRIPKNTVQAQSKVEVNIQSRKRSGRALDTFLGRNRNVVRDESMAALRQNVMDAVSHVAMTAEECEAQVEAYQAFEKRRQFEQINGADGYVDLRDILMIKSLGEGPTYWPGKDDKALCRKEGLKLDSELKEVEAEGDEAASNKDDVIDIEEEDIGGEEGLLNAKDRSELRKSRQFEVVMSNGRSTRFEAYSVSVARDWIKRLAALARYWRRREKVDALELMNASGFDPTLIQRNLQERSGGRPLGISPDSERMAPVLAELWHWCALEGCRGIIRCGMLYQKKSGYSPFKRRYFILIAGRLLNYKLVKSQRTARSRQNAGIFHRRQETVIHFRDAYVYSGKLSEDMLNNVRTEGAQAVSGIGGGGSNAGERHRLPRVYADGLFSVDDDEDCTFVIRYRPERVNQGQEPPKGGNERSKMNHLPQPPPPTFDLTSKSQHEGKSELETTATMKDGVSSSIANKARQSNSTRPVHQEPSKNSAGSTTSSTVLPTLADKSHKFVALRARSKLERDQWVRCISYEIERLVRDERDREMRLKNVGSVEKARKEDV
ncbi:hypothetical protein IE53DRAFT_95973 [Violaceomyces palustris]|uniref:Uncharacterized protein n=1 Tax=Violaceomyces palustris TaxID=1673888 RepID=A0ACD0P753_9BASI|nr:hypothetical protein IE53DRAFT_95973 [Violaceomyces palustris]